MTKSTPTNAVSYEKVFAFFQEFLEGGTKALARRGKFEFKTAGTAMHHAELGETKFGFYAFIKNAMSLPREKSNALKASEALAKPHEYSKLLSQGLTQGESTALYKCLTEAGSRLQKTEYYFIERSKTSWTFEVHGLFDDIPVVLRFINFSKPRAAVVN